jgi:hypothetical protein
MCEFKFYLEKISSGKIREKVSDKNAKVYVLTVPGVFMQMRCTVSALSNVELVSASIKKFTEL